MNHPLTGRGADVTAQRDHTIVGILRRRASEQPDAVAYRFLPNPPDPMREITYRELDRRANAIATRLRNLSTEGERVLLLHPAGLDFVEAFFGCLYAGVIAVPAFPPRANRTLGRLSSIAIDCGALTALVPAAQLARGQEAVGSLAAFKGLRWIASDASSSQSVAQGAEPVSPRALEADAIAYLQYTSGSTSEPKGVQVSHGNVMANSEAIRSGFGHDASSRGLSWLPHFHDMGLIDGILQPIYAGFPTILMDPLSFLQNPGKWLEAISDFGVTHSGGPNFAYDLCLRRVPANAERIDLRTWDVAYNGAEPVRAHTLIRFAEHFAPCGFRSTSFYPAYGLAEATLKVSGGSRGDGPTILRVNRAALEAGLVSEIDADHDLVGAGTTDSATQLRIVDPAGSIVSESEVGEIWVTGPSVAHGYWNKPAETNETFGAHVAGVEAAHLRTGDLGFVRNGMVFVTGRLKDLIIIRGRNIYPQDVESTAVGCSPVLRQGSAAAFSVDAGVERLVITLEVDRHGPKDPDELLSSIRAAIVDTHEIDPSAILLVKPGTVPKTSSGKVQRAACKRAFLEGALAVVAEWHAPQEPLTEATAPEDESGIHGADDVRSWLEARIAAKLGVGIGTVAFDRPLAHFGLDSLRSTELAHEIETRFGVAIHAMDLLGAGSLEDIARRIPTERPPVPLATGSAARSEEIECPLSAGQLALWFLQELAPESTAYIIASALRTTGLLDEAAFARAVGAVVARHPSLRARIVGGSVPRQRFDVPLESIYEVLDWPEMFEETTPDPVSRSVRRPDAEIDEFSKRLAAEAYRPFDFAGGLFRIRLLRQADRHVLLISAHHTVVDLWSLSVVLRDLQEIYANEFAHRVPAPSSPPTPPDFVAWQQQMLASDFAEEHLAYWRKQLAGEIPALDLPVNRARPAVQSFRGATLVFHIDPALASRLRDLAKSRGVTLYVLLLAGFQAFLARVSGQRDVLVGAPVSGRTHARFADLVGYLVNTIVLRADLRDDPTFAGLLRSTQQVLRDALVHQAYPFPTLVKHLAPARDASRSPFFDVMFELRASGDTVRGDLAAAGPGRASFAGGISAEAVSIPSPAAQFDLSVTIADEVDALGVQIEYNTDLFDQVRVEELAEGYLTLLRGALQAPDSKVSLLPLLGDEGRRLALGPLPPPDKVRGVSSFHRMFEERARLHPERIAAHHGDSSLTYGELNQLSNRLARRLHESGVGIDTRVAVHVEKSLDLVAGFLSVMKCGGAYVPIDPALPLSRRQFLVADAECRVVLARPGSGDDLGLPLILLERGPIDPADSVSNDNLAFESPAEALAYVIYTSGTTGVPKGVAITNANLASAYYAWERAYDLGEIRSHLQMAGPSFDVFTGDFVRALGSGGTLVLVDRDTLLDPPALETLARRHAVEFAEFLPATLRELAAHVTSAGLPLESLKIVAVGSDAWLMADYLLFRNAFGPATRILNSYGVTEATVDSTLDVVTPAHADRAAPSIGLPLENTAAYVLDTNLDPVLPGMRGDLYLGGPAVARGYVGRPDLTADRFVPDPNGPSGSRMYRTGDSARRLSDGRIEFLGREDAQIKIRGFRVEPSEIEAVLEEHAAVRTVAVVPRERASVRRLVAYVVAETGHVVDISNLREHVSQRLPEYMVPAAFVVLDAFPLTPNAKIDRKALPDPEWTTSTPEAKQPETGAERVLAEVWRQVLALDHVGARDNFFELGGDSILGIQVVARAREKGLVLTARMLFEHPVLADLARAGAMEDTASGDPTRSTYGPVAGEVPLLPIQRWFFAQPFADRNHWNMAIALDARTSIDAIRAREVIRALIYHHDALRARFRVDAGGFSQHIEPVPSNERPAGADGSSFQSHGAREAGADASSSAGRGEREVPYAEREQDGTDVPVFRVESASEWEASVTACATHLNALMDIERGPVFRAGIVTGVDSISSTLVLVAHHLVVDGVSWRILAEDFDRAYTQLEQGTGIALPARTVPISAFAEELARKSREAAARSQEPLATDLEGDREQAAIDEEPLPFVAAGAPTEGSTRVSTVILDGLETQSILGAATTHAGGVEALLLSGAACAIAKQAKQRRVAFEMESHGRDAVPELDVSRTVGWFTRTYPLVVADFDPSDPFDGLRHVSRALSASDRHGEALHSTLSAGDRGDSFRPPTDPRASDLPTKPMEARARPPISFNYLGRFDSTLAGTGLFTRLREPASAQRAASSPRTHALEIDASITGGCLSIRWAYSPEQISPLTMDAITADFRNALMAFAPALAPDVEDALPLTAMQEGMLFHHLRGAGDDPYIAQITLDLEGKIDLDAMARAWQTTFDVHPALRAEFDWNRGDSPSQRIRKRVVLPVRVHHDTDSVRSADSVQDTGFVQSADSGEEDDSVQSAPSMLQRISRDARSAFDVSKAPLARLDILPLDRERVALIFTHHHLLFDGWSLPFVFETVFDSYERRMAGDPASPANAAQTATVFREYFAWRAAQDTGATERFFREQLAGFSHPTPLPTDNYGYGIPTNLGSQATTDPIPGSGDSDSMVSGRSAVVHAAGPGTMGHRARALGLTTNTVVEAAWSLVLSRCTGEKDVLFGATSSGRPAELAGLTETVGLFINTTPVRVQLDPRTSVRAWMHDLQRRGAELRAYDHASLAEVQRYAAIPANTPLFETLLVFENYPIDVTRLTLRSGFSVRDVHLHEETNYPLTIVTSSEPAPAFRVIYDTNRCSEQAARGVLERLIAGIEALLSSPDALVGDVDVFTDGEREFLHRCATGPVRTYPRAETLVRVFDALAARRGDATALLCSDESLSYRTLRERSGQVAASFSALGVREEARIAVALDRSIEFVVTILGILRSGCAYVPMDPDAPLDRVRSMCRDSRATLLIAAAESIDRFADLGVRTIDVRDLANSPADPARSASEAFPIRPESLAYIMFTSGSTGEPKGIEVTHRNILNLAWSTDHVRFGPGQTLPHLSTVVFDASTLEIWTTLLHGGCLAIAPPGPRTTSEIARFLRDAGATSVFLTTGLFQVMVEEEIESLLSIPRILTGGDVLSPDHVQRFFAAAAGASRQPSLVNLYGPTEATTYVSSEVVTDAPRRRIPIGGPIANTRIYVLSDQLHPVPVEAPGELHIGGDSVSRGYSSRPDLTAERFLPDPWGPAGSRMYRTGDIARWRSDGRLEFLGRRDGQIKIRGFRIELGEIEHAILASSGIRSAAVITRDTTGGPELVACVVSVDGADGDSRREVADSASDLRASLSMRLPKYMIPARIVFLDALPLNPSGKVDRAALLTIVSARSSSRDNTDDLRPRRRARATLSPMEGVIAAVWRKVLDVPDVDPDDDFFELGGHSLHATRVMARVGRTLQVDLPLRALFDGPTVRRLARQVEAARQATAPRLERAPESDRSRASYAQQRLWFLDRLEPESAAYNIAAALRIRGSLSIPALEHALSQIVARHEALRTRFEESAEGLLQIILAPAPFVLPIEDMRNGLPTAENVRPASMPLQAEEQAQRRLEELARNPFDLTNGPLLRGCILRLGEADHILSLTLHHIAADGWSIGVLIEELAALYVPPAGGAREGTQVRVSDRSELRPPDIQYADWSAWQRAWLEAGEMERQLAYWKAELEGLPALSLPTDRPRPARPNYAGASIGVSIDSDLSSRIEHLAQAEGATLHMVLLASFAVILGRWSGQSDFGIGTPVANRTREEVEDLIGCFVNTLVFRPRLSDTRISFRDLVAQLRRVALDAYAHQDVPFERVVEAVQPERDLSRTPLFQVMFILQNTPTGRLHLGDAEVAAFEAPTGTSTFDLTVSLEPPSRRPDTAPGQSRIETMQGPDAPMRVRDVDALDRVDASRGERNDGTGDIIGTIEYSTELFDEATIRRFWSHIVRFLDAATTDPDADALRVPILAPEEKRRALSEWSGRSQLVVPSASVYERFRRHAAAHPERIAAILHDKRTTYGEIAKRASDLAAELAALGIGRDDRVGLCLERSPELLVGMIASWQAGAAFVPLDPDHPHDRIAFALDDSAARVVLTTRKHQNHVQGSDRPILLLDDDANAGTETPLHVRESAALTIHEPRARWVQGDALTSAAHLAAGTSPSTRFSDLAYVIYTSGTTGRPKGAMISQGAIAAGYEAWELLYSLDTIRVHLQMASVGFDVCTGDVVRALGSGGTLVFCDRARLLDPAALFELADREKIEFAEFVPAVLRPLAAHSRRIDRRLASFRIVAVGSDVWTTAEIKDFQATFGEDTRLANSYGVTEATVDSSCWFVEAGLVGANPPIGRPLAHSTVYVLDHALEPTPPGVIGELYLGGPGLGRGYIGRPDMTAERFLPDPHGEPGARLYRTGDRARYLPDGQITFAGRADDQVKIRGQRVELAEIEAAISSQETVGACVVVVRQAGELARLAAYVVPSDRSATFDTSASRQLLRERLPEAWVPSAFVVLESLPLTPNGKVDRRRLPEPEWSSAVGFEPPATRSEIEVAAAFADLLNVPVVGAGDDFFALGGHSLLAVRVISRLRSTLSVELPMRTLFEASTVRELAQQVDALLAGQEITGAQSLHAATTPPRVLPATETERRILSYAQQRLWFLDRLEPDSPAYNLPTSIFLRGTLDVDALRRSLSELVRRHEALRTRFAEGPLGPEQRIEPATPIDLAVEDLSSLPVETRLARTSTRAREESRRPFDLRTAPLLRACLFRLAHDHHCLLVTVHHICADGWSLVVLVRELGLLYGAFSRGEESPLVDLQVQYADWAAWQRHWLESPVSASESPAFTEMERQLGFWRNELRDSMPLVLPSDRPRPARPTYAGASIEVRVDAAVRRRLETLARTEHATLHMALLAGFANVLARWSDQTDFAIGTPVANRRTSEAEPLIGFFVNTLALRVRAGGRDLTFRQLLDRIREAALTAQANQDVPFERVVEELQPDRSLGHTPLFQVLFALQNVPVGEITLPGLQLSYDEPETGVTRFDLELALAGTEAITAASTDARELRQADSAGTIADSPGELEGLLNYSTELFDPETVERFLETFLDFLQRATLEPDRPLADFRLLPDSALRLVLHEWNARTERYSDSPLIVHRAFEDVAARAPDSAAAHFGAETLTYGELNARANQLAHFLARRGIGPDHLIAISIDRSFDMLVALLGTMKSGAAYVPIDPEYPPERIQLLLADARVDAILTRSGGVDRVHSTLALPILLDQDWPAIARESADDLELELSPDALVYSVYTSGSTGKPKGVAMTHRAISNLLSFQRIDSRSASDHGARRAPRTLQFASLSFDVSFQEIFSTLTDGGAVVLVTEEERRDMPKLLAILEHQGVERLFLPFVALNQMAEAATSAGAYPSSLREIDTAGEQLKITPALRAFFARLPECRLVNHYGPSETHLVTVFDLKAQLGGDSAHWPELPSIGRAIPNAPVYLLDQFGQLVPIGTPGELYVGGAGLARGYHDRPDLTADRFVPDPFSGTPGARLYRTGDLARYRNDGNLEFLGRSDLQVKIRGHRVEPGEIESVLTRHPAIRDAAVKPHEHAGGRRLAAYIVLQPGSYVSAEDARSFVGATLPEYMVPSAVVALEALPLTPNGKVDRAALPEPSWSAVTGRVAPRTPEEELVCAIFAEVLEIESVGAEDDFFELGGHSLLATRVISRVRAVFGAEVPLRALFEAPTPAGVAAAARNARLGESLVLPAVRRAAPEARRALSYAQQRLWFLHRLDPASAVYNLPVAVRLSGDLDQRALEVALTWLVARHESLRTRFVEGPNGPEQVIDAAAQFRLDESLAINEGRGENDSDRIRQHLEEEASRPFDLARGPLLRARLIEVSPSEHVLSLVLHHIAADGWSLGVLWRELAEAYRAARYGEACPFSEPAIQYADWAAWQRAWLSGGELDRQLSFWRSALDGAPPALQLPTDRVRPTTATWNGSTLPVFLPRTLLDRLAQVARTEGATLQMVLLAGYAWTLLRYAGQDEIVVGTPIANRRVEEAESLIGFFVNTLPIRIRPGAKPSFRDLLQVVRAVSLDAYAHQDVPFERLVEEIEPERSLNRAPIFQTAFALQDVSLGSIDLPGLTMTSYELETETAKFDLMLILATDADGISGGFEYNTDLYDRSTIARISLSLALILDRASQAPDAPMLDVPLMTEHESDTLLREWSRGQGHAGLTNRLRKGMGTFDPDSALSSRGESTLCIAQPLLHTWIDQQGERSPDAIALRGLLPGAAISYRELESRSNRLARLLHVAGAKPDRPIALLLERSPDAIVAMLAILKSGAPYLPLDPADPDDRLHFALRDSGVEIVVTLSQFADRLLEHLEPGPVEARASEVDAVSTEPRIHELSPEPRVDALSPDSRIDAPSPEPRVDALSSGSDGNAQLTESEVDALSPEPRLLCLDRDASLIDVQPDTRIETGVHPQNLAYLIYTSGSTGRPKAVGVEHAQITDYVAAVIERLEIGRGWNFALVSTLAADLGHTAIFPALVTGGTLTLVSPDFVLDAGALASAFQQHPVDCMKIVPSHLDALLSGSHPERVLPKRLLIVGGEATSGARFGVWRGLNPECRIANHYGPTETTVGTIAGFPADDDSSRSTVPLGRPLAHSTAYILDAAGHPVPTGVVGELCLGGSGVARGYVGRPDLTAARFLPDPFSNDPGARMYRTGDRARWLPDGRIEFLGRGDAQVKIRGFRVELGEIEAALESHERVKTAAVIARDDATGSKNLVAYVVPQTRYAPTVNGLHRRLLPGGIAIAELNRNETDYIHREIFELRAYVRHGITIRSGDTIFDVGGNIGLFSIFASLVRTSEPATGTRSGVTRAGDESILTSTHAQRERLFVFEPNPYLSPILRANLAAYAPTATVCDFGLAESERHAEFTFFPGFSLLSGLYADAAVEQEVVRSFLENQASSGVEGAAELAGQADALLARRFAGESLSVRLRPLSAVFDEHRIDRVHLLKINVEKAELDVLRGIDDRHWDKIDQAVVEVDVLANLDPIVDLFRGHGFDVFVDQDPLLARTELRYVYAVRHGSGRELTPGAPPSAQAPTLADSLVTIDDLRRHLGRSLPGSMQPAAWVFLESLPVTGNGKLDRRRLPDPSSSESRYVAPRGDLEAVIADIWKDALCIERVGVHDNFFDLGGHSLLLTRVHARLRERLAADISVVELFQYPTIAALAERLSRGQGAISESDASAVDPESRGAQRRAAMRVRSSRGGSTRRG